MQSIPETKQIIAATEAYGLSKNQTESQPQDTILNMVHVAFKKKDDLHDFLVLSISKAHPVRVLGNADWLDFRFEPFSEQLERKVSFVEDSEEWARSLPAAYSGSGIQAYICPDPNLRKLNPSYQAPSPEALLRDPVRQSQIREEQVRLEQRLSKQKETQKKSRGFLRRK